MIRNIIIYLCLLTGTFLFSIFLLRLVLMVFVPDGCFNSDNLAFAESAFYDSECTLRY